jgi:hypothetical protein
VDPVASDERGDGTAHVHGKVFVRQRRPAQHRDQLLTLTRRAVPVVLGEPDHGAEQVAGVVVPLGEGIVGQHRHGHRQQDRYSDPLTEHDPQILGGELGQRLSPELRATPDEGGGVRTRVRLPNAFDLFDGARAESIHDQQCAGYG